MPWLALAAVLLTPLTAYPHLNHSGNLDCPETLKEGETGRITLNFSSNGDHFFFSHGNVFGARFENSNRTAVRPGDYTVDTGGKVGGSGKKRVGTDAVTVQDDLLEGPETFTVSAYQVDRENPSYVDGVRTFSCTITILDDETLVVTGVRVSSNPQRGDTYRRGETIEVSVTFSHEVEVRGNPLLSLFLGTSSAWRGARYAAGSGSKVLKFRYTVQPTDRDTDGITISASDPGGTTSGLGGGEILDNRRKRLEADRSYARMGNLSGHKVDGRATVEEVRISSRPSDGDTYRRGETIEFEVEFNEAVEVEGAPVLSLGVGSGRGAWRGAGYAQGSGSTVLRFRYTVRPTDRDTDGVSIYPSLVYKGVQEGLVGIGSRILGAGTSVEADRSYAGAGSRSGHRVDGRAAVEEVRIASRPSAGDTYRQGETIEFEVRFSEAVTVRDDPERDIVLALQFDIGTRERLAVFVRGSGTDTLRFEYTVTSEDSDPNGISIQRSTESAGDGLTGDATVVTKDTLVLANPAYPGEENVSGHEVDGSLEGVRAPDPPSRVEAEADDRQVTVSWTTPGDGGLPIMHYEYREREGGGAYGSWRKIPNSGATTTSHPFSTPNNGTPYAFRIRAVNAVGPGARSDEASATPAGAPDAPARLTASPSDGQVRVSWTTPGDGGSAITHYEYQEREGGGEFGSWAEILNSDANTTSHPFSTPNNGTPYAFRIRAVNKVRPGAESAEASATPRAADDTAPVLQNATVDAEALSLRYSEALNEASEPPAAAFTVTVAGASRGVGDVSVMGRTVLLTLAAAVRGGETVTVSYTPPAGPDAMPIRDEAGNDAASIADRAATNDTPATAPEAPVSLTAAPGNGEVTLTWTAPYDGGSPIRHYEYQEREGGGEYGESWRKVPNSDANTTRHTFITPNIGTRYAFRIRAVNEPRGPGAESGEAGATPHAVDRTAPDLQAATVDAAALSLGYDEALNEASEPPAAAFTVTVAGAPRGVDDDVSVMGRTVILTLASAVRGGETVTVSYAPPTGTEAMPIQDEAGNDADPLSAQAVINNTPATAPDAPASLTASPGNSEVTVSWTAPYDGGSRIRHYEYQEREGGGEYGSWGKVPNSDANTTSHPFMTPNIGTRYAFRVRAVNEVDPGDASNEASATPHAVDRTAPDLQHAAVDATALSLSYDEALNQASEPPAAAFTVAVAGASRGVDDVSVMGRTVILTLASAVRGGETVTVISYTAPTGTEAMPIQDEAGNNAGPLSAQPVSNDTPATAPDAPARLTAATGNGEVTVRWTAPYDGGSPIRYYEYQEQEGGGAYGSWGKVPNSDANTTSYPFMTPNIGTRYAFRIRAVNEFGPGTESGEAVSATPDSVPDVPDLQDATVDAAALSLSYDEALNQASEPPAAAFTVTVAGAPRGVDDVSVMGRTVILTLASAVRGGETVTVSYTPPTGTEAMPIQDEAGNYADPLSAHPVINNTPAHTLTNRRMRAALAGVGQAVATQVVNLVSARLEGGGASQVTVGGERVATSGEAALARPAERMDGALRRVEGSVRTLTERELVLASSFHLRSGDGEGDGPAYAAWGQVAMGRFELRDDRLTMQGRVTTGMVGVDVSRGPWLAGAAVSSSHGQGEVVSRLASIHPYVRVQLGERASAWGVAGYGGGELTVAAADETPVETGLRMRMGAVGARGTLASAPETEGFELAVKSDAFWTRMNSDAARGVEEATADALRLRFALEASQRFETAGGGTLTPRVEVGLRHDGGDAARGTGIEAGAAIRYRRAGVAVGGSVRAVLAHEAPGYEEWGASGSVRIDPGAAGHGLSLTVAPGVGSASSGVERLWSRPDANRLAPESGGFEARGRLDAEVGYGFNGPRRVGVVTPYAGIALTGEGGRSWRAGARWQLVPDLTLAFEGTQREPGAGPPGRALMLRGALRW